MHRSSSTSSNECLRLERIQRNWRQQDLADHLGTTATTVKRWERGNQQPSAYFRIKLCALFGKSAEALGLVGTNRREKLEESETRRTIEVVSLPPSPDLPRLWAVPLRRNPFFTGRGAFLRRVREMLCQERTTALTRSWAISGLGGIGKTQVALEYAHRYREHYQAVLWIRAEMYETLLADCRALLSLLDLPESSTLDPHFILASIKQWLCLSRQWLLILDNVEDMNILADILPSESSGHVLLTTRSQIMGPFAERLPLEKMTLEDGTLLLLRRARFIALSQSLSDVPEGLHTQAEELTRLLDEHPLALDQAGAYLEETGCGLLDYLVYHQTRCAELLSLRGSYTTEYQNSVMATLQLSIEKATCASPVAIDLLRLCSFLSSEGIPGEIASAALVFPERHVPSRADNPLALDATLKALRCFSLISRHAETNTLSIHQLVQIVVRESMDESQQRLWAERAIRTLHALLPEGDVWAPGAQIRWQRYLAHILSCATFIERWQLTFPAAIHMLYQTGVYLAECARYQEAERLYRQTLALCQQALEPEHPRIGEVLNDLAVLASHQGRDLEAEALYQQAQTICERSLGTEHPFTLHISHNLAVLYQDQGKNILAEELFLQILHFREMTLGSQHLHVAETLLALASVYTNQQRFPEAEPLIQRSLLLRQQHLGKEHPLVAQCLTHLGKLFAAQGKSKQAEKLLVLALTLRETALGPDHPQVAICLHALGDLFLAQADGTQAEAYLQRALRIREKSLPPEHRLRAATLRSLAKLSLIKEKNS